MIYADNSEGLEAATVNRPPLGPDPGWPNASIAVNGQSLTVDPTCINLANLVNSGAQLAARRSHYVQQHQGKCLADGDLRCRKRNQFCSR